MFYQTKAAASAAAFAASFGINVLAGGGALAADTVFTDDVIVSLGGLPVRPGICIGGGCVTDGEDLTQNKLRFKESVLRVHFIDTTTTFPGSFVDWRMIINAAVNNGTNFFAIQDIDSDTIPFRIDSGARDNALRVDLNSQVGLGTATPAGNLHIKDGDTPDVVFEQDGSGGFTPYIWGIGGNHTGFGISDVTGGDTIPVGIEAGAPTDSLRVSSTGQLALGTDTPESRLHVKFSDPGFPDLLRLENTGSDFAGFRFTTTGGSIDFNKAGGNTFRLNVVDGDTWELQLNPAGDLTIKGSIFTAGGTCGGGCDRVFDAGYKIDSIEEHAAKMWKKKHLPNVGPTAENQPINLSDKTGRMLNELEVAHIYIAQLNDEKKVMKAEIDDLRAQVSEIDKLKMRLLRLEEALSE